MSEIIETRRPLPVGSIGHKANGWWGMLTLVATEGALFAYLLFSYFYFQAQGGRAFLPDDLPRFALSGPNTVILLASSIVLWWAEREGRRGRRGRLSLGLLATLLLGNVFVAIQFVEWHGKTFTPWSSAYGSLFFAITGFHMAHVVAGLVALAALLAWNLLGYFDTRRNAPVAIGTLYWHFVDAVWLAVFASLYVTPHLL
jgi:heme/copper-type cytochrome/quinol oxidase subunit 3